MLNDFDYKKWCNDNKIKTVVDMIHKKSPDIYKQFPSESCVYVPEWHSTVAEIYSEELHPEIQSCFQQEINFFKNIDNIERVLYMFTEPNKDITEHVDDDDTETYRILVGVHSTGDTWFENVSKKDKQYLTKGKSLGINVEVESHRGRNNTNDIWTMLIICLYKDKL